MTLDRLLDLALMPAAAIPAAVRPFGRLSLADWAACGIAGAAEPVARLTRGLVVEEAGVPQASLFGGGRVPARAAALANGTASHALDYDDTHFAHVGHPSVAILPAALAMGQARGAALPDIIAAFLIGAEASVRFGLVLGAGHYNRGFHQTATAGAIGATVAAGRLAGLDRDGMGRALGLVASRAAGVRAQFGSMGKPWNAGIAAAAGVECALLAAAGMTAASDGLFGPQGMVATHSDAPGDWPDTADFLFADVKYKLHACCHGTHAMIEGLLALGALSEVTALHLRTAPRWMTVCNIPTPRTGLEVKFSYRWLAAMVLSGRPTADEAAYTDACAMDPALAALAARVQVTADSSLTDLQAAGEVVLEDGRTLPFAFDLGRFEAPATLEPRLRAKAAALIGLDRAAALWQATGQDDTAALAACMEDAP